MSLMNMNCPIGWLPETIPINQSRLLSVPRRNTTAIMTGLFKQPKKDWFPALAREMFARIVRNQIERWLLSMLLPLLLIDLSESEARRTGQSESWLKSGLFERVNQTSNARTRWKHNNILSLIVRWVIRLIWMVMMTFTRVPPLATYPKWKYCCFSRDSSENTDENGRWVLECPDQITEETRSTVASLTCCLDKYSQWRGWWDEMDTENQCEGWCYWQCW